MAELNPQPNANTSGEEALRRARETLLSSDAGLGTADDAAKACVGDEEYETLKQALTDYYQPVSPIEHLLVERIAILDWRLKRSILAERRSVHAVPGQESCLPPAGALERILKYERTMDGELHRAISALEQLRSSSGKCTNESDTSGPAPLPASGSGRGRGRGRTEGMVLQHTYCEKRTNEPADPFSSRSNDPNPPAAPDFKVESPDFILKSVGAETDAPVEAVLEALFHSAARIKLLGILLLESPGRFYIRELAAKTGLWFRPVQRELANLAGVGLVLKEVNGQQAYYRINDHCPLVPELRSMFSRATAVEPA